MRTLEEQAALDRCDVAMDRMMRAISMLSAAELTAEQRNEVNVAKAEADAASKDLKRIIKEIRKQSTAKKQ